MEKNEEKNKVKKKIIDPYGGLELIESGRGDKNLVVNYSPFTHNDILSVTCSNKTIMILLKNGTIVTWGEKANTLGRKLDFIKTDCYYPHSLKMLTKIIDIACGREHCLAKGLDYKVYSWGGNSYGQVIFVIKYNINIF
jgi:alpha-tubulin suppressor-like RCC1 family protein